VTESRSERHAGRTIVDKAGEPLGVCRAELADSTGRVLWVGVELEAPAGTLKMVPLVEATTLGDALQVAYDRATVVGAPHAAGSAVHAYYRQFTEQLLDGPPRDWP
jgi:hypothetical protein